MALTTHNLLGTYVGVDTDETWSNDDVLSYIYKDSNNVIRASGQVEFSEAPPQIYDGTFYISFDVDDAHLNGTVEFTLTTLVDGVSTDIENPTNSGTAVTIVPPDPSYLPNQVEGISLTFDYSIPGCIDSLSLIHI